MNTPDTEWSSVDRYSVETGLLKRFFKLYEEGRKTGDPQNFIDYFKAEHYLLTEVGKAITSRDTYWKEREALTSEREYLRGFREAQYLEKERVRKEVEGMKKEHIPADNIWEGDEEEEVGEWKLVPKEDGMYCLNCKRFTPEEGCICGLISFEALDKLLDNLK